MNLFLQLLTAFLIASVYRSWVAEAAPAPVPIPLDCEDCEDGSPGEKWSGKTGEGGKLSGSHGVQGSEGEGAPGGKGIGGIIGGTEKKVGDIAGKKLALAKGLEGQAKDMAGKFAGGLGGKGLHRGENSDEERVQKGKGAIDGIMGGMKGKVVDGELAGDKIRRAKDVMGVDVEKLHGGKGIEGMMGDKIGHATKDVMGVAGEISHMFKGTMGKVTGHGVDGHGIIPFL